MGPVKRGMQGTVKGPAPSTCDDPTEKLNVRFESEGGTVQGEDWIVYSNSISRTKPKTLGSLNLPGGYTKGDTIYSVKDMGTTTDYPVKRGMQGTVKGPAPSTCDDPTEKLNVRFESEGGTVQGEDWI